MKTLNLDNSPCSPTSSNCVIWQGPDLVCINLCTGDTVSDVIAKLATELCTIMEQLKISNYLDSLSCFNLQVCPPSDFKALIQFLIEKICESEGLPVVPSGIATTGNCPDCVVNVAPCFVVGSQTTMQLTEYVNQIGNRICEIFSQINVLTTAVNELDIRVTNLENTPAPVSIIPSILVNCTLDNATIIGGNVYPINDVLAALVNNGDHGYCSLLSALGQPVDILAAAASACISSTDISLADSPNAMSTAYPSWITSPFTLSDTVNNLWLSVCDIYTFLSTSTTFGKDGRGVAVFVGGSYGAPGPTNTNLATDYALVPGFGVNALPGALTLKAGDIWIRVCP